MTFGIGFIDRRREDAETKREQERRDWQNMLTTRLIVTVSSSLRGASLAGAKMMGLNLRGKDLSGADLRGADLRTADLYDAVLSGAFLTKADLRGAYLWRTDFRGAHLQGADFRNAWARGTDFRGAYLDESTDFSGADLRAAGSPDMGNLKYTTFQGAVLVDADEDIQPGARMKAVGAKFDMIEWPIDIGRPEGAIEDLEHLIAMFRDKSEIIEDLRKRTQEVVEKLRKTTKDVAETASPGEGSESPPPSP